MTRSRLCSALCVLALSATAVETAAAQFAFHGVRWGAPREEVAERIRAAGYTPLGMDQWGDPVFRGPDGAWLVPWISPAGLVAVDIEWKGELAQNPVRFALLTDSLRALHGPTANEDEEMRAWRDDDGNAVVLALETGMDSISILLLSYSTLDRMTEIYRRDSLNAETRARPDSVTQGAWRAVGPVGGRWRSVDRASFVVLGSRMYGARVRDQPTFPDRLDNGLLYDEVVADVELDCQAGRSRTLRRTPLYHGRATPALETPPPERRWAQPPPESEEGRAIAGACAILDEEPR